MPKVSIIMPSLNIYPYIRQCMSSVTGQSLEDIEIICIDAGSTDGTAEILQEYASADSRISVIHSQMKSYGKQVNIGIDHAKGKYIGIVETDDYVAPDMFEKLYQNAERYHADISKANYDSIWENCNGVSVTEHLIFPEGDIRYQELLHIRQNPEILLQDINIWSGIYRSEFLRNSRIRLNETSGAAFQDIGFIVQALSHAENIVYQRNVLYHYRLQRDGASTWNKSVLHNAYAEWERLLSQQLIPKEKIVREFCYRRMTECFACEYEKILQMTGYNQESEYVRPYYQWFTETIYKLIRVHKSQRIEEWGLSADRLKCILSQPEQYASGLKKREREKDQFANNLQHTGKSQVCIVGCGAYGKDCYHFCGENRVKIDAFCDNNPRLWNNDLWGIRIHSVEEGVHLFPEDIFIIACKNCSADMKKQLMDLKLSSQRVLIYQR